MKTKRSLSAASLFIFLLISRLCMAQGPNVFSATPITDAFFQNDYTTNMADKGAWFRFVTVNPHFKGITINTNDVNALNKIVAMNVYKGSASSLKQIATASLTTPADNAIGTFIDSTVTATGDTVFIELIKGSNTSCTGCDNNKDIHYTVTLDVMAGGCSPVTATIDAHNAVFVNTCQLYDGMAPAEACTLKVCAGEQVCIRFGFLSSSGYPLCGPGTVTIPPAVAGSNITVTNSTNQFGFNSNYCFTASSTPGIWLVAVDWFYVPSGSNCNGEPLPGQPINHACHGFMYIQVGPPAPPAMDYTINPNPACVNTTICFNANSPNLPGYQYYYNGDLLHSSVAFLSPTGNGCVMDYHTAGTFTTSLTVNNGFCQSPSITHTLSIKAPALTGSVTHNNCRNYTFTANPVCLPPDVVYTWNINGTQYTGSPLTITIPGNNPFVLVTLTGHSQSTNSSWTWNTSLTGVDQYITTITQTQDGCGNVTYTATPSACIPANAIYTWTTYGITELGNPITIDYPSGTNPAGVNLTVSTIDGTVLCTSFFQSTPVPPQSGTCCADNTLCYAPRNGTCTTHVYYANTTLSGTQVFNNCVITVEPNVIITIDQSANITFNECTFLMYANSGFQLTRNAASLAFTNSYLHGCKKLWNGVKFVPGGSLAGTAMTTVRFENSVMEDAYIGFDFSHSPDYVNLKVANSILNKNIYGIKFLNQPIPSFLATSPANKITVTGSVFCCKAFTFNNAALANATSGQPFYNTYMAGAADAHPLTRDITPFNNPTPSISYYSKSLVGISLEGGAVCAGCPAAPFSNNISATDNLIYDNLVQGLVIKGLNLPPIRGNTFNNITSPLNGGDYPTYYGLTPAAVIYSTPSYTTTTLAYQTIKVGSSFPVPGYRNKFTNCYYGVYARDKAFDVFNNDFVNCYNGVHIANANVPAASNNTINSTIRANKITGLKYTGIMMDKNISIMSAINNNTINNNSNPNFTSRAIDIVEANKPVSAKYAVENNPLSNVWQGARANQLYNPEFSGNVITLNTDNSNPTSIATAPYNTGIQIIGCEVPVVGSNTVTNSSNLNTWWEHGISSVLSRNGSFYCNTVDGTFSGITTGDDCSGTLIFKNDISNAWFAHWMIFGNMIGSNYDPVGSSFPGYIKPADNRYYNIGTYYSYTQNQTNGQQNIQFYVRGNNAASPFALFVNGHESISPPSTDIAILQPSFPVLPYTKASCNGGSLPPGGRLMSLAKKVATDVLFPANDAKGRFTSRTQLLSNLQKDNIGATGDVDIDNFATLISKENVSKLFGVDQEVQKGIDNGDPSYFTKAGNMNDSIAPADSIEKLQQQVNAVYLDYLKRGGLLDKTGIIILQPIAALCPYQYGSSIWEARAILVGYDNTAYFNACELLSPPADALSGARMAQATEEVKIAEPENAIAIYPNPNAGSFKVELPAMPAEATIELVNTIGAVVKTMKQPGSDSESVVEIQNIAEGLYFVIVKANGMIIGNHKVVVTK